MIFFMSYYNQEWINEGNAMFNLAKILYPICRSITGNGVRETLGIIKEFIPIKIFEVPTGTKVFDWVVPKEWNIREAFIKNSKGEKIIDFKNSNLHVLNYSIPINKKLSLKELKEHLFSLPEYPNWIPYLTSYYDENWGFCLTHNQLNNLEDDIYEVLIDSTLEDGFLTYGELYLNGESEEEILFSTYICHPSLCNDNLSGPILLTSLAKKLIELKKLFNFKYSYRFLFIPETIGAITWLNKNQDKVKNIKHGLVATCLAGFSNSTYKTSRIGNALIDKVVEKVLIDSGEPYKIMDFSPIGSDERQFCSPGFNLPVGSLMRTVYNEFPEYHTSADNLDLIDPKYLANNLKKYLNIIYILENNKKFINLNPKCEPQLGKRNLYPKINDDKSREIDFLSIFWVLNLSDGTNSLLDIAIRSKHHFDRIKRAADLLVENGLLSKL